MKTRCMRSQDGSCFHVTLVSWLTWFYYSCSTPSSAPAMWKLNVNKSTLHSQQSVAVRDSENMSCIHVVPQWTLVRCDPSYVCLADVKTITCHFAVMFRMSHRYRDMMFCWMKFLFPYIWQISEINMSQGFIKRKRLRFCILNICFSFYFSYDEAELMVNKTTLLTAGQRSFFLINSTVCWNYRGQTHLVHQTPTACIYIQEYTPGRVTCQSLHSKSQYKIIKCKQD